MDSQERARHARLLRRFIITQRRNRARGSTTPLTPCVEARIGGNEGPHSSLIGMPSDLNHNSPNRPNSGSRRRRQDVVESSSSSRRRLSMLEEPLTIENSTSTSYNATPTPGQGQAQHITATTPRLPELANQRKYHTTWSFGGPSVTCSDCGARVWIEERVKSVGSREHPKFSICCQKGKVQLPKLREPP